MKALAAYCLLFMTPLAQAQDPPAGVLTAIGIEQKLNAALPLDLHFFDESGRDVTLKELFRGKPVVLSLVYYECPMLCSMTLNGLVKSMRPLPMSIGDEFDVVTISFDPAEKPPLAAAKKDVYVGDYGREGAAAGWHFLTASADSIRRLTDAAGYRYQWDEYTKQWAHASAIVIVTADGRISQYLYGIEFSPRDLRLSLVQASENRIGSIVDRVLLYCYRYDPVTGRYGLVIMNTVRIASLCTVLALAAFILISRRREA
jgi:protein SCO1/2